MVAEHSIANRSQMIADLIRADLAEHFARECRESVPAGTITLICRAERGRVRQAPAQVQLGYAAEIVSAQHVFLQGDQSLEALLVQDKTPRLHKPRDAPQQIRGVQQCRLITTTVLLPPLSTQHSSEEPFRRA